MGHLMGETYKPMILGSVTANHPKMTRRHVEFMADTGSDITALSKKDIVTMGISYDSLRTPTKSATGIGSEVQRWKINNAILRFQGDDNKVKTYGPMDIFILRTLDKTPSLLGRDFIINYNFKLIYDYPQKLFYLEK